MSDKLPTMCAACLRTFSNAEWKGHVCKANEPASGSPKESVVQSVTDTDDQKLLPVQSAQPAKRLDVYEAVELACAMSKLVHDRCERCDHSIGLQLMEVLRDRGLIDFAGKRPAESKEANLDRAD